MTDAALFRLLAWSSPAYPVGAFSYSHGLETAVQTGQVDSAESLESWLRTVTAAGSLWVDLLLFRRAWQAASDGNIEAWHRVNDEALARRSTGETARESLQQGLAFHKVTRAAWPGTLLDRLEVAPAASVGPAAVAYATAFAAACAPAIPLRPAMLAYGHAFIANLVSAGIRLIPLGQTDGQRVLAAAESFLHDAIERAQTLASDTEPATAAPMAELQSIRHETQYTRLFRS